MDARRSHVEAFQTLRVPHDVLDRFRKHARQLADELRLGLAVPLNDLVGDVQEDQLLGRWNWTKACMYELKVSAGEGEESSETREARAGTRACEKVELRAPAPSRPPPCLHLHGSATSSTLPFSSRSSPLP